MHNNTHSVHKRLLLMWRARLLCLEPFRYVYPPPLSDTNCPPFPPPGGPGPPTPKMTPFSPGSTHTLSTLSVTLLFRGSQTKSFKGLRNQKGYSTALRKIATPPIALLFFYTRYFLKCFLTLSKILCVKGSQENFNAN